MYDKVTGLLGTHLGIEAGQIEPEISYEELGLDSLALIEFTMIIKRELGIALDDDALAPTTTIAHTVRLLESNGAPVG